MCDSVDRLPVLHVTHSDDDDERCIDNTFSSETKPTSGATVCHRNKPSVHFVVPVKQQSVNGRNEWLTHDERDVYVNVARPVVMQTLSQAQTLTDKCSCTSSNLKLSHLQSIYSTCDAVSTDELLHSSVKEQNFAVKCCEPNVISQSEAKSSELDAENDCVVKNDRLETSLTVSAGGERHTVSHELSITSHSVDVSKHSNLSCLSETVVEQPSELSLTNDSVRTQWLLRKDSQLKRVANKSKLMSVKVSPGSLSLLRKSSESRRLSLKEAVGGTRPRTYSLLEVAF